MISKKELLKFSPSALNLFLDCPRCFWLDRIKKIKRPNGIFPSLPSGMDKILKEYFDKHRIAGTMPKELEGKIEGSLFKDIYKLNIWRQNFHGLRYIHKETNAVLMGAIDDLFVTKQGLFVPIDFKTRGYPLKPNTHEFYQNQMNIYTFLLEKNGMKTDGFALLIFYHPKKINGSHDIDFNVDVIKLKTDKNAGEKLFLDGLKVLQGPEPEPNPDCHYCNWEGNYGISKRTHSS